MKWPLKLNLDNEPRFSQRTILKMTAGIGLVLLLVGVGGIAFFIHAHRDRIYPGVYLNDLPLGELTHQEASQLLAQEYAAPPPFSVKVIVDDIEVASSSGDLGLQYHWEPVVSQALAYGKTGPLLQRWWQLARLTVQPQRFAVSRSFNSEKVEQLVYELKQRVDSPTQKPRAELKTSGNPKSLIIFPGELGREVTLSPTVAAVLNQADQDSILVAAPVASTGGKLSFEEIATAQTRAENLVKKQVVFKHPDYSLTLNDQDLISLIQLPQGIDQEVLQQQLAEWQKQVTREPQDAEFVYDPTTLVVSAFTPPLNGLQLNTDKTKQEIEAGLSALAQPDAPVTITKELVLAVKPPRVPLSATNDLGINEQLGLGESRYAHSIPTRIHNVALTATKINNNIVKPGEEFSFNKTLGDVSAATGFQPAYIIKDGQTVLGDGGGVCQVSTTLFRALLDAGLKVTKRRPHSYRVTYYELNQKPGFDATVYAGDVDLRFVNDTAHPVLIHSQVDSQNLYMNVQLYGTSDGRQTEITDYKSSASIPAPPPVFTVDPSLPPGTKKQVDWAASGIKTSFKNVVKNRTGEIIREDVYTSNYIPWSAKYLVGP